MSKYELVTKSMLEALSENQNELAHARRVLNWIRLLEPNPSEELMLAAYGHDLAKWEVERGEMDFHKYRTVMREHSAKKTGEIVRSVGYEEEIVKKIQNLILNEFESERTTLGDADCLDFMMFKLPIYREEKGWNEEIIEKEMRNAYSKMSPKACSYINVFCYNDRFLDEILRKVISSFRTNI